jgi:hypothetical protein
MMRVCLLAVFSAATLCHAFMPHQYSVGSSTFVQRQQSAVARPFVGSSSALQMNLFDRFARVAKSNLNNVLKNLEDPEKIMNQAVEDMQVRNAMVLKGCRVRFRYSIIAH